MPTENWFFFSSKGLQVKDASKMQRKTVIKIAEKAVKRYDLNPGELFFKIIFFPNSYAYG